MQTKIKKALAIIAIIALTGCAKDTPTSTIADGAILSAQAAIHVIKHTTTLEQCQAFSESEINGLMRDIESIKVSAQSEIKAEQTNTTKWKIIAGFVSVLLFLFITKRFIQ